ncbi:hypothetical protein E1A91_A11G357000v1 [Gossypium mustelinum]|uniref:Uncharacterized protein n=1 Tax=Gossypium mustelinum TaxID=34275 RepID=A0A5D2XEV5_GOSMU|nr:hypothetical protein E1A91_A11G357000v1 [Gossypium mustelinum]
MNLNAGKKSAYSQYQQGMTAFWLYSPAEQSMQYKKQRPYFLHWFVYLPRYSIGLYFSERHLTTLRI